MNKLTKLLLNHFIYSMEDIDFDWNLLTEKEKESFENEDTFNTIVTEAKIYRKNKL